MWQCNGAYNVAVQKRATRSSHMQCHLHTLLSYRVRQSIHSIKSKVNQFVNFVFFLYSVRRVYGASTVADSQLYRLDDGIISKRLRCVRRWFALLTHKPHKVMQLLCKSNIELIRISMCFCLFDGTFLLNIRRFRIIFDFVERAWNNNKIRHNLFSCAKKVERESRDWKKGTWKTDWWHPEKKSAINLVGSTLTARRKTNGIENMSHVRQKKWKLKWDEIHSWISHTSFAFNESILSWVKCLCSVHVIIISHLSIIQ